VGTPLELYDTPANRFVASFIGLPPMNFFDATVREGELEGRGFKVKLTEEEKGILLPYAGKEIELGVRPEDVIGGGEVAMNVFSNENLGMNTPVHGHIGQNNKISAKLRGWYDYKDGDNVNIAFSRKHFFDKETGVAIGRGQK
jgi:multiple sugar transport system ATP-binding protein